MNYFILLLFAIILVLGINNKVENFKCIDTKLMLPLKIGSSKIGAFKIQKNKNYVDTNLVTTEGNINRIIHDIQTTKPKYRYTEFKSYQNNYYSITGYKIDKPYINNFIDKVFKKIKPIFNSKSKQYFSQLCNNYTNCNVSLRDKRVKLIGYNKKGNIAIEGQLLIKYNVSSYNFLLDFVASNENTLSIHYLSLKEINIIPSLQPYNINTLKFIDGKNPKIYTDEVKNFNKPNRKLDEIYKFSYSCYGRKALTKGNCENKSVRSDSSGKSIGVWDKKCEKNSECPFYKANKNYDNEFGRCKDGKCELPLGAIRISPRKFRKDSVLMCHNCKKGTNCCKGQKNKKLYPNLKSPDYMFLGDEQIRKKL